MSGMFWTDERVATLKRMREDGYTFDVIAERLGCTRNAISGKVDRLGLARPPRKERIAEADKRRERRARAKLVSVEPGPVVLPILSQPEPKQEASGTVSFAELREHHCRWILNDDMSNPVFCGEQKSGRSYCEAHRLLAYVRAG
jgi:hypothetical protein